ncbi:HAD domain-containing protein [Arthrobacter sp. ISL-69]|uniref:HAD domain-containing protein n=1 Tax=Arthrobacter sp. ISL-69 TaxID=2819113 RepID=UPI001BEBF3CF|nr:HAD domain-containing protein [Arthrobacter sp. ISL-69]MBT2537222.1 hypothetical protein [Arthrobacter sp. ISL-69]
MSTTIYLDVDGVLNAVNHKSPSLTAAGWDRWDHWKTAPVNGWPILWAPALIEAFNELAARDDVTFKWLTTWEDDAAKVLSPAIGINGQDWEVLHGEQHSWRGSDWWKLQAIRADVETTNPERFVWIDDDLSAERVALEWLGTRPEGLGVSPSVGQGLTRTSFDTITDFINQTEEAAA